jgi:hypothetical protein
MACEKEQQNADEAGMALADAEMVELSETLSEVAAVASIVGGLAAIGVGALGEIPTAGLSTGLAVVGGTAVLGGVASLGSSMAAESVAERAVAEAEALYDKAVQALCDCKNGGSGPAAADDDDDDADDFDAELDNVKALIEEAEAAAEEGDEEAADEMLEDADEAMDDLERDDDSDDDSEDDVEAIE